MQNCTGRSLLRVYKAKTARNCALSEQAFASTDYYWKLPDTKRIDKILFQQRLQQIAAAVNLNLATFLCFEFRNLLRNVAPEQV